MADIDVPGYLRRLGLAHPGEPSVEGLYALTRAHIERVAYTSVQVHLGQRTSPDPYESARRIVAGEAGYCYHLNGAFSVLLEALGYDVLWHRGRVWSNQPNKGLGPIAEQPNHLPLTVEVAGEEFFVDTGLGDALHEPVPLAAGSYTQGPYTYRLEQTVLESGSSGWSFFHDPAADSFDGMVFEERIASLPDFLARHEYMETDPESGFVQKLDVVRRDATGIDYLRSLTLKRRGEGGVLSEREITSHSEWYEVLADVFGLRLPGVSDEAKQLLFKRTRQAHEEWLASQ